MNKLKYYCLRYQPYLLGVAFFLAIFLVWAIGRAFGFASLHSLLAGIGVFLLLSAGYVLLLYRGVGQHHNLEGLLRDDADNAYVLGNIIDAGFQQLRDVIGDRLASGAIEIALVGDLDEAEAIAAVASTFGALPAREAEFNPRDEARVVTFTAERGQRVLTHKGEPDQALLHWVWPTTDDSDLAESMRLNLLARIVRLELTDRLREKLGQAYSPSAGSDTSHYYPGYGTFAIAAMLAFAYLIKQSASESRWYKLAPLWLLGIVLCFEPVVFRQSANDQTSSYWMVYFGVSAFIVAGILLARLGAPPAPGGAKARINWAELGHDVFFGKSVLLLAGGLLIGTVMGEAGTAPIAPVFMAPFKGVLALFLLELGLAQHRLVVEDLVADRAGGHESLAGDQHARLADLVAADEDGRAVALRGIFDAGAVQRRGDF